MSEFPNDLPEGMKQSPEPPRNSIDSPVYLKIIAQAAPLSDLELFEELADTAAKLGEGDADGGLDSVELERWFDRFDALADTFVQRSGVSFLS